MIYIYALAVRSFNFLEFDKQDTMILCVLIK